MKTKISKAREWVKTQSEKFVAFFRKQVDEKGTYAIEMVRHHGHRFSVAYSKSWVQFVVSAVTYTLSWVMLTTAFPMWLAVVIMSTAVAHEVGHIYAAKQLGYSPRWPFFVPVFFMIWSGTHIPHIEKNPKDVMTVAVAGPTMGILVSGVSLCIGILTAFPALAWAGFWMLCFQFYAVTFGSDGRRYRRAQKEITADVRDSAIIIDPVEAGLAPAPI